MSTILIVGLLYSAQMALIALGFSLTFGISGVANLAYGAMYILGGYFCWHLLMTLGLPYWLAVILAVIGTGIIGAAIYRLVLLRVRGIMLSEVIATFGLGIAILELLRWGGLSGYSYALPPFVIGNINILGITVAYQRLIILVLGLVLVLCLWIFTHHTRIGRAFRGIAQNERTALSFGINSDMIGMLSVSIGTAMAAIAAITILPEGLITVNRGYEVLIIAFAVGIVAGLESTIGIVVAAFILGFSQTIAAYYAGTHWIMIVNLLAIIVILVIKPSGLFGKFKELEERV
jgi:branched-chain amino acid transport system permease protein